MQQAQTVGFFDALGAVFSAVFNLAHGANDAVLVGRKVIHLADNEIVNIEEYQQMRLDTVKAERKANKAALAAL